MIPVRILGTASALTGSCVTTGELVRLAVPGRDPADVEARSGITTRHWVDAGATVADLGVRVLRSALAEAGLEAAALRRLVLVTSTGGDMLIPATANAVLDGASVPSTCDAFDLNNACMGFLSAFDVAARSVATGRHPVAVVTVETLSRFVRPEAPRPYLVLGDAAAAIVLGEAANGEGMVGHCAGTETRYRHSVTLGHPGLTGREERIEFADSSREMTAATGEALERMATSVAAEAGLALADIDWVVPHQPNGAMLDQIIRRLGIRPERLVRIVHEVGSVGAASIPVGLDRLLRQERVRAGQHILLLGVGAGMAYGAVVYRAG